MGCTPSINERDFQTPVDDKHLLDDRQKRIVRKTWRPLANDMTENGQKIFINIFESHPEIKYMFPTRDIEGRDNLSANPHFRMHSSRFMQSVGAAIDNLNDLDNALRPLLVKLAKTHVRFKGFKPDYFDAFEEAMLSVWQEELGQRFTTEVEESWKLLFFYIKDCLKEGYDIAMNEKTSGELNNSDFINQ
ncbi:neuroglobin-like [Saccoglossus kowalevskii]|uniref:Globin-1-like n=1 Tax=Saccoglossus kowalevskii TaxID=10224 RepID=A0ABM0MPS7_SACKO|nr:PREDICTED: globin-1-like [Saccoglossus kowalevskii]